MILTVHVPSFKSYVENPLLVLEIARACPGCLVRTLSRHGGVLRWVYLVGDRMQITVHRLRCRACRLTVTLLPDFLLPYTRYAATVVEAAVEQYLAGAGSHRAVAVALNGAVVPAALAPSSMTDAIEMLHLQPSYQRVHAWGARIAATAVADVQAAAAWVVARVPTSTVVDLQTVPLDPPTAGRTRDPAKRAGLDAARMLVRLFGAAPELNPRGTGWLPAWGRFVAAVARRTPWAPPRSPPEPRTS